MILFKEDWDKPQYRGAIIDYTTKNQSFIDIVGILENMNVENRFFPLALVNKSLQGIDPHDPELPRNIQVEIAVECKTNPWYFFREVLKAPSSGGISRPIRANRGNIALWWLFFNHVTSILIQPRQTGKSFSTDSLNVWNMMVGCLDTIVFLYTKDDRLRTANIARLKALIDELPSYLDLRTRKDTNNTEEISVMELRNRYITSVAQSSEKAANNVGRGLTLSIIHVDEPPFSSYVETTLKAMLPAHTAARENARVAGNPHGIIYTTTCGYLSSESGRYFKGVCDDSLPWNEKLFDCKNEQELVETIKKNNIARIQEDELSDQKRRAPTQVLLMFNHRQLGYTDQWLAEQLDLTSSEGDSAKADFLNQWVRGNEASPISRENLDIINNSLEPDPVCDINQHRYITNWYITREEFEARCPNRHLLLILDPSEAVGRDDIGLVVRDIATGANVAVGRYNETNVFTFGKWIVWWLLEFPKLTLLLERRSVGIAYLDIILQECIANGIDPFKRIFNWMVDECHEIPEYKEILKIPLYQRDLHLYTKYRSQFGYATSGSGKASRDNIYGRAFNSSIKHTGNVVKDKYLINQLNGLIFKNGRIDHKPGEHDDLVFCWCMGWWFLTLAKNKHLYGIPPNIVLSDIRRQELSKIGGEEAVRRKEEQMRLKDELNSLKKYINSLSSPVEIDRYKALYDQMASRLETTNEEVLNIDEVTTNLESVKRSNGPQGTFLDRLKKIYT